MERLGVSKFTLLGVSKVVFNTTNRIEKYECYTLRPPLNIYIRVNVCMSRPIHV